MKGYWHLPAIAAAVAFLSLRLETKILFIILITWLFALLLSKRLGSVPLVVSLLSFLFFYFYLPPPQSSTDLTSPTKNVTTSLNGKIISSLESNEKKVSFLLKERTSHKKIQVIAFLKQTQKPLKIKKQQLKRGATCTIKGELGIVQPATNPGEFDFQKFSREKGIEYQLIISESSNIMCSGSSMLHLFDDWRQSLMKKTDTTYSEMTAAWLKALVLGDDSSIPEEVIDMFREWGLSHLLAISGLHVGLIVGLIYFLLIKTGFVTMETAKWAVVIFLPIYSIIAGSAPSVLRASFMGILLILFSVIKKQMTITDTIAIVFLLLVLFDKHIVSQAGFQFSFLISFSLILSSGLLAKTDRLFFQMLFISFISQMVIVPIQMQYFSSFQPLSILLNVFVVPYFSFFVIPLMFILLLLIPFNHLFFWLDLLFQKIHILFLHVLTVVNQEVSFPWVYGYFPGWAQCVYFVLLILFLICLQNGKQKLAFLYGTLSVCLIMAVVSSPYLSPYGKLTMLDMGQGDAFILELPHRKGVFFLDAGARLDFDTGSATDNVYEQIIKPYLKKEGITKIDGIFISHEDVDHMGSVDFMVKDLQIKNIIISPFYPSQQQQMFWKKQGITIHRVTQGNQINISGQSFAVVSPSDKTKSANENSLVLWTKFGGKTWLFTGDIGKDTEKNIMQTFPKLKADVLKVGHHGSKNSSDKHFIEQIQPQFALISAGRNNRYGHPHQEVLEVLQDNKAVVLRTDKKGAIIYKYRQHTGTFFSYLP